jgi:ATP-dependent Lon protease
VAQREARVDAPQPTDLYTMGTVAVVHKVVKMPNQSLFVFAEGLERVRVDEYTQLAPFMRATVSTFRKLSLRPTPRWRRCSATS